MKKKKLLVFLLSASLCAAGAAGLAACKPEDTPPPEPIKAYTDYTTYTAYKGGTAKEYDSWLSEYAGKAYTSVENTEGDDLLFTYTDGSTSTVTLPKLYTVFAKDNRDNGVKDVYTSITSTTSTVVSVHYTAKTDEGGYAYFYFEPEANKTYEARLANPEDIEGSAQSAVPLDYKTNFGTSENNINITSFDFGADRKVTLPFLFTESDFFSHSKTDIGYKRVAYDGGGLGDTKQATPAETRNPLALAVNLKGGVYSYVYFNPYVDPGAGSDLATESIDLRRANARVAAAGKYRIKVNGNARLYKYDGSSNTMQTDDYGIPSSISAITGTAPAGAENAPLYTGTDYIEINNYTAISNTSIYFGVYSDINSSVTVTVTRVADADEPAEIPLENIAVPDNLTPFVSNETGSLIEIPVNGTVSAVLGSDGYYHVGSANGPLLLVNLNKPISRAATAAISRLPYMGEGNSELDEENKNVGVFQLSQSMGGTVTARYDYNDYVAAISQVCNNDGVYPVDETMKGFLTLIANRFMGYGKAADGFQWLLPCQYIQPANGLPASGSGTSADPYVLIQAKNAITSTGTAHLSFNAAAGVYMIETSGELVCKENGVTLEKFENIYFVTYTESTTHNFTLTGGGSTVTVSAVKTLQASASTENLEGSDADHAILANSGVFNVVIDPSVNQNGVFIKIEPFSGGNGTYVVHLPQTLYGKVEYDGQIKGAGEDIRIIAKVGESYVLRLTSGTVRPVECNYMLYIYKENSSSVVRPLNIGNNDVVLDENSISGIKYSFTPETGGYYEIKTTAPDAIVFIEDAASGSKIIIQGGGSYVFNTSAGETISFTVASLNPAGSQFTLSVASTVPELKLGENKLTFTQDDQGKLITFKFTAPSDAQTNNYVIMIHDVSVSIDGHGIVFNSETRTAVVTVYPGETLNFSLHKNDFDHDDLPGANTITILNEEPVFPNAIIVGEAKAVEFKYSAANGNSQYQNVIKAEAEGTYTVTLQGAALEGKTIVLMLGSGTNVTLGADNDYTARITLKAAWEQLNFTSALNEADANFTATLTISAQ